MSGIFVTRNKPRFRLKVRGQWVTSSGGTGRRQISRQRDSSVSISSHASCSTAPRGRRRRRAAVSCETCRPAGYPAPCRRTGHTSRNGVSRSGPVGRRPASDHKPLPARSAPGGSRTRPVGGCRADTLPALDTWLRDCQSRRSPRASTSGGLDTSHAAEARPKTGLPRATKNDAQK